MKRINQKKIKHFVALCEKMLIDEFKAERITNDMRTYNLVIQTRIGKLFLRVDGGPYAYSVFGNFLENTEEAKKEFGHWKYNTYVGDENTLEEAVEIVRGKILLTQ